MVLEAVNECVSRSGWGGGYFVLFRAVSVLEYRGEGYGGRLASYGI